MARLYKSESTEALNPTGKPAKKSLYERYIDARTGRNIVIPDEELKKYTGMTMAEIKEWAKNRPGVAGNQPAGLGGYAVSQGYGGWGSGASRR